MAPTPAATRSRCGKSPASLPGQPAQQGAQDAHRHAARQRGQAGAVANQSARDQPGERPDPQDSSTSPSRRRFSKRPLRSILSQTRKGLQLRRQIRRPSCQPSRRVSAPLTSKLRKAAVSPFAAPSPPNRPDMRRDIDGACRPMAAGPPRDRARRPSAVHRCDGRVRRRETCRFVGNCRGRHLKCDVWGSRSSSRLDDASSGARRTMLRAATSDRFRAAPALAAAQGPNPSNPGPNAAPGPWRAHRRRRPAPPISARCSATLTIQAGANAQQVHARDRRIGQPCPTTNSSAASTSPPPA